MGLKKRSKIDSGFSMSSMTDIVFLLLIFFMITSTMVTPPAAKNIELPQSNHQVSAKPNTTISVSKDLNYYVSGEQVSYYTMKKRVKEIMSKQPETYIALHVDESVPFYIVKKIRSFAIENKYKLILATQPKK